jgi:hypothetical protein
LVQTAANDRNPPILLKNFLLRLQIFRNQKAILRLLKHIQKCRRNFRNSEYCSAKFAWNTLYWSFSTESALYGIFKFEHSYPNIFDVWSNNPRHRMRLAA